MSRDVHSCTHWLRLRNSPLPPPAFGVDSYYESAIGQHRKTTSLCNPLMSPVETNCDVAEVRRTAILLLSSAKSPRNCFHAYTVVLAVSCVITARFRKHAAAQPPE
jgi:hypothetical protein